MCRQRPLKLPQKTAASRRMALRTAAGQAFREQPIKYWHTLCIMTAQTHLIDLDIDPDEDAE